MYMYLGFRLLPAPECQVDWKRKEKLLELERGAWAGQQIKRMGA